MTQGGKPEQLVGDMDITTPTAMAFDSQNRPYLINNRNPDSFGKVWTLRNGQWVSRSFVPAMNQESRPKAGPPRDRDNYSQVQAPGELVIDDQDGLYATVNGQLIYSQDSVRLSKPTRPAEAWNGEQVSRIWHGRRRSAGSSTLATWTRTRPSGQIVAR